ncbi:2'-5' RNA ligase [Cytophagales bacterium WSM2-2]|nr:2'-5' RNA ligase [Cytophagales bacterium WSM2-2]
MDQPTGMSRYFIAIIPPSPIEEEAMALKNHFKEKYNSKGSLNSAPHITLHMPFMWKEKNEEKLIGALKSFVTDQKMFPIALSGFGSFPPRVVFINVKPSEELNLLQSRLQKFCKSELNLFNAQYKDLPFHPHITIAFRDLKKDKFAVAWSEFREKTFEASFPVNRISLLKHDTRYWQPLYHFDF